jgi:hypothetical protein
LFLAEGIVVGEAEEGIVLYSVLLSPFEKLLVERVGF